MVVDIYHGIISKLVHTRQVGSIFDHYPEGREFHPRSYTIIPRHLSTGVNESRRKVAQHNHAVNMMVPDRGSA